MKTASPGDRFVPTPGEMIDYIVPMQKTFRYGDLYPPSPVGAVLVLSPPDVEKRYVAMYAMNKI